VQVGPREGRAKVSAAIADRNDMGKQKLKKRNKNAIVPVGNSFLAMCLKAGAKLDPNPSLGRRIRRRLFGVTFQGKKEIT
jgi:hypothetical protein